MAHTIQITYGSTTIDLNSGSNILLEYVPETPALSTISTNDTLRDGGERTHSSLRNVTETARFMLRPLLGTSSGSSASAMQTTLRNIGKAFEQAKQKQQSRAGDRVYLNFKPDGGASTYRSEILGGKLQLTNQALNWRWSGASSVEFLTSWTRRFYWEGPELGLKMSNRKGSNVTTGSIVNHKDADATDDNYVEISASDILGEIPTPIKLNLTNDHATYRTRWVWIANNVFSSPSSFDYVIEGEDSTTGTVASYSADSGGSYISNITALDGEADFFTWTLSASQIEHANGNYFHALARFHVNTTDLSNQYRFNIRRSISTIWSGPQVQLNQSVGTLIRDLGVVPIPPWGATGLASPKTVDLVLAVQKTGGTSACIDFIHLFPSEEFRTLDAMNSFVDAGPLDIIVDDGIENTVYIEDSGSINRRFEITTTGRPIKIYPEKLQRLYFLTHRDSSNNAPIDHPHTIKISYRPRVLQI